MSEYPTHDPADPADYFGTPLTDLRSRGAYPNLVPASRTEQVERLRHLADLVETHEDAFDMREWIRLGETEAYGDDERAAAVEHLGDCGTSACLGGWAVVDLVRQGAMPYVPVGIEETAGAWLGLSFDRADALFYAHWHPEFPRTREQREERNVSWFGNGGQPEPDDDVTVGDITAAEAAAFVRRLAEHAELMAELERGVAAIVETGVTAEETAEGIAAIAKAGVAAVGWSAYTTAVTDDSIGDVRTPDLGEPLYRQEYPDGSLV